MRSLRLLLTIALTAYMSGFGSLVLAQESDNSPYSITLAPVQYANVKGNVANFQALNWMPNGYNGGISDLSFVKDINKNISLSFDGSEFPEEKDGTAHLTLKDGDLAFLKLDYNAFRKYYDNRGGVNYNIGAGHPIPLAEEAAQQNSPNLQMDISFFKLETGIGAITDPFIDFTYEHDSKNGDKSLLQWTPAYNSSNSAYRLIGPSYEQVNSTSDTVTMKEKKEFAGITFKGDQRAEIDYNNSITYMPYLNSTPSTPSTYNQVHTQQEYPDAKLFGTGVRAEKWMFNDNTFAGLGYHYNQTHDTDVLQNQDLTNAGVLTDAYSRPFQSLGWSLAKAQESEHVWIGNFNTNLRPDLALITDAKYEHMGSNGSSTYYEDTANIGALSSIDNEYMENKQDNVGEHVSLRYSGITHTSLYAETDLEQNRDKYYELYTSTGSSSSNFLLNRINRNQKASWSLGGSVVPNRFFTFNTEFTQRNEQNKYDTLKALNPTAQTFLDSLGIKGIEESSTLTWKPYHWLQNSLKYQFYNTQYQPQQATEGTGVNVLAISENHMLTSEFTYDITIEPIDPLLIMLSYSHVENYVRTLEAAQIGGVNNPNIPDFNSGDNSWLLSVSYTPTENITLTNSACYTISPNYVDFNDGVPYGSSFQQLTYSTGLQWTYHKWLKISPTYEYAAYRESALAGGGNYSANIFELNLKFDW